MSDALIKALRTPAADLRANPPDPETVRIMGGIFGMKPPPEYKQGSRGARRKKPEVGTGTVQNALYESVLGHPFED